MKFRFGFLFVILLMCSFCEANVFKHLRKVEDKTSGHSIRNIDFIYLINLDNRPEKLKMCFDQLNPYGIHPFRFSAIYGWDLSLDAINDIGVKYAHGMNSKIMGTTYLPGRDFEPHHEKITVPGRTYYCHCLSRGCIGIILSHLSVIKDAHKSGYKTVWIMEDDIQVIRDPRRIPDLIDELDEAVGEKGWDILFTDRDIRTSDGKHLPAKGYARRPNLTIKNTERLKVRRKVSKNIRMLGSRFGATSMIIRRSGMKKILRFYRKYDAFHPYDMDFHLPKGMRMFTVVKDVISNKSDAISDNGVQHFNN